MEELENGAVANGDENRQVGHYWLRDPARAPAAELRSKLEEARRSTSCTRVILTWSLAVALPAFRNASCASAVETQERVKEFARKIITGAIVPPEGGNFRRALICGIGGSALGPMLTYDALGRSNEGLELVFLDNTDPVGYSRALDAMSKTELAESLVIVISKSGGTPETQNALAVVQAALSAADLALAPRAVSISCFESALDKRASIEQWTERFWMEDWVGGRTSLFSAVGLLPAALQGACVDTLLAGAREMDHATRSAVQKNPALELAHAWYTLGSGKGERAMVVLPYRDQLVLFSRYLQQLVMESLGKCHNRDGEVVHQGLAVYGNKGSTDQHAFVQQLRDGRNDFFVVFIESLDDGSGLASSVAVDQGGHTAGDYLQGFLYGTREALTEAQRPSITITVPTIDEKILGALIALFERAVGFYAEMININAYHQPGVEAGKKAAKRVLELVDEIMVLLGREKEPLSITKICEKLPSEWSSQGELVYVLLRRLSHCKRVYSENANDPLQAKFAALCASL